LFGTFLAIGMVIYSIAIVLLGQQVLQYLFLQFGKLTINKNYIVPTPDGLQK